MIPNNYISRAYQLWDAEHEINPGHHTLGARWEPLLSYSIPNRYLWFWRIQRPFGNSLWLSHTKECWSRPGWHHQQGRRFIQVQGWVQMSRVGVKTRKWYIYNLRSQWCASIISRAVSGSSWPHHRLLRRLHIWDYFLHATKRRPPPSINKKGTSAPE